jgi:hypothetical protein
VIHILTWKRQYCFQTSTSSPLRATKLSSFNDVPPFSLGVNPMKMKKSGNRILAFQTGIKAGCLFPDKTK